MANPFGCSSGPARVIAFRRSPKPALIRSDSGSGLWIMNQLGFESVKLKPELNQLIDGFSWAF
jgi:hypothetical protein